MNKREKEVEKVVKKTEVVVRGRRGRKEKEKKTVYGDEGVIMRLKSARPRLDFIRQLVLLLKKKKKKI